MAERVHWAGEFATFLLFVGVAVVQTAIFYRLRRTYVEHLAMALSVCAWFLAMLALSDVLLLVFWHDPGFLLQLRAQSWVALLGLPIYWSVSIHRFYALRWPLAIASGLFMAVVTALTANILNALLIALLVVTT